MTEEKFEKIIELARKQTESLAYQNNFYWFCEFHVREVIKCAELLLTCYPNASKEIVIISCWYHDIAHFLANGEKEIMEIKPVHHLKSAEIAEAKLTKLKVNESDIERIVKCIQRHRNQKDHQPQTIEEKIVACADALSHFHSVFYMTYFKLHPNNCLKQFVNEQLQKLERDWRDAQILPEGKIIAQKKYEVLKQMLLNY